MFDIYATITDSIVNQIEKGAGEWKMPWHSGNDNSVNVPVSVSGRPYNGINVLLLWSAAIDKGYTSPVWGTFNAWKEKGASVKKGEKSTLVVLWTQIEKKNTDPNAKKEFIKLARGFNVFNSDQVTGYKKPATPSPWERSLCEPSIPTKPTMNRIANAEQFFNDIPATVIHGGNQAYYRPSTDTIVLPSFESFNSPETYYGTRGHETVHWTGDKKRCDREFGKRFGDNAYAFEELVAELGAAFLSAYLELANEPRLDHAAYLSLWLQILNGDKKAIFTAASQAQKVVNYLTGIGAKNNLESEREAA